MKWYLTKTKAFLHFLLPLLTAISLSAVDAEGIDLLPRYPTHLTSGDLVPEQARPWDFSKADIFRLSQFDLQIGTNLQVKIGPADVGIGHCSDGALWAVVIPRVTGTLVSSNSPNEPIAHVWLRFHPATVARIFPPATVFADGDANLAAPMRRIANQKMFSSFQAGGRAMIPETNEMTVDIDTVNSIRRFFAVDTAAQTVEYISAFEKHAIKPPPDFSPDLAAKAFDKLWETFDRQYAMFVLRPEVDWAQLRDKYRSLAIASHSTPEFADVCAEMLRQLRDLHVWLTLGGSPVPVFNRPRTANSNPAAHETILGSLYHEGQKVQWTVTADRIGFIAIYGWDDPQIPDQCQRVLEKMRDTRGLIIDVRLNGGGSEDLALQFAGRFLNRDFTYASDQMRNGPAYTNLTEHYPRIAKPIGPWRYDRPVVLLIGQKCMSSNESFVGMMTGDPLVTTMGDQTCGSSGNPQIIQLPLEMTVSVPQWIDYLPDGTPLDEHGFQPQVPFKPSPDSFSNNRDDLLSAALEHLRPLPLPEKPIAGPAYLTDEEAEAQDESRPKVISVFPPDGSQSVALDTTLRIRFDRPMNPFSLKLDWESGGILDCEFPSYNPSTYEFSIPVRLAPGQTHHITVNKPFGRNLRQQRIYFPRDGFLSADHRLARLFRWEFHTVSPPPANASPPKVVKISPAFGSKVPYRTTLEIQFDQPMEPPTQALPWLVKSYDLTEPRLISDVSYDATNHTFRLPLLLMPGHASSLTLAGFYNSNGVAANHITVNYQVSNEALSVEEQEKLATQQKNPQLLKTLAFMQQQRTNLTSLAEQVQVLMLFSHNGPFNRLLANSGTFKWQQPGHFAAEAADMMGMCSVFAFGSDCQYAWWHDKSIFSTNFEIWPIKNVSHLDLSFADPFDLMHNTPAKAAADSDLSYLGTTQWEDVKCHLLEGWGWDEVAPKTMTPIGFHNRWWIDAETGRPLAIQLNANESIQRTRFFYNTVNQPLPQADFAAPGIPGHPLTSPDIYTNRFFTIHDGSDGNIKIQFSEQGPHTNFGDSYIDFN